MNLEKFNSIKNKNIEGVQTMRGAFLTLLLLFVFVSLFAVSCSSGGTDTPDGDVESEVDDVIDGDGDQETADGDIDDTDGDKDITDGDNEQTDGDLDTEDEIPDPGSLVVAPSPIIFDSVSYGMSTEKSVTMKNSADAGSEDIKITHIELTNSTSTDITLENCNANQTLKPGEEYSCSVTCMPSDATTKTGQLRVLALSQNGDPLEQRVDITCFVIAGTLAVNETALEFGNVDPNEAAHKFFSFTNAGLDGLTISEVAFTEDSSDAFSIVENSKAPLTGTFSSGMGRYFEIRFNPLTDGQFIGWLKIKVSGTSDYRLIPVTGRTSKDCPENTKLVGNNSCYTECIPRLHQCTGDNSYRVCSDSGDTWGEKQNCPENLECVDGYCTLAECQKGVSFCKNNKYYTCGDEGTEPNETADCTDDEFCSSICMPAEGCKYPNTNNYCNDLNPCTDDVCNKGSGCTHDNNTNECDDNNPCTENTSCLRGSCVGQQIKCNDDNQCTEDYCDETLGCRFEPVSGGCTDDDACTVNERCEEGQCVGDERTCDDSNDCTTDTCNSTYGCVFTPTGLACDDGNPCTVNDSCVTEECKGVEKNWDDGLYCNGPEDICDPTKPEGSNIIHPNPVVCNDNIACTVGDYCDEDQDTCVFTPDDSKCNDNNPCTLNSCVPGVGCTKINVENNTTCDIIVGVDEICINGVCVTECTEDWQCQDGISCTSDYCDKSNGYCVHEAKHEQCSNGLFCDGEEICDYQQGCIAGTPPGCSDEFSCTFDSCDEVNDTCKHLARDSFCNDFNDCTLNICKTGEGCSFVAREGACDDGDPCTLNDSCQSGICLGGGAFLDCDDDNVCTDDQCITGIGCRYSFNVNSCDDNDYCTEYDKCVSGSCIGTSLECDDGVFCNGPETCLGFGCQSGEEIICDDNIDCTVDQCSEDMFGCEFIPDDSACMDDNPCTENERCSSTGCKSDNVEDGTECGEDMACYGGVCVIACETDEECNDEILCTEDICDPETSHCRYIPDNGNCSDSLFCNGYEICDIQLGCISGTPPDCDDDIDCTVDGCDENNNECTHDTDDTLCTEADQCHTGVCDINNGCSYLAVEQQCDDNNICTVNDYCHNGVCKGDDNTCDDLNPCTVDSCNVVDGCTNKDAQDGTVCGSGVIDRVCMSGKCVEGCVNDLSCDDGIKCTLDACNTNTRQCSNVPFDDFCDDGYACNGAEICNASSGCEGGTPIDCDDLNPCTTDSCNPVSGKCENQLVQPGTVCEDMNVCTISSTCNNICEADEVRSCPEDDNPCTVAFCDPYNGCTQIFVEDNTPCGDGGKCLSGYCATTCSGDCSDNNICTIDDRCENGFCIGTPVFCDDGKACTNDRCDATLGCINETVADDLPCITESGTPGKCSDGNCVVLCSNNADCDDAVDCTEDICTDSGCVHNLVDTLCNDNNECTNDTCTLTGCDFVDNTNICNDENLCTENDVCSEGTCQGTQIIIDDDNKCTEDYCDPAFGEYHVDISDSCTSDNQCINAICDPEVGCRYLETVKPCDDGNACTMYDTCSLGECSDSFPRDCDDLNDCTVDACDAELGCTHSVVDDMQVCEIIPNEPGVCVGGICKRECVSNSDCVDLHSCSDDICNTETGICEHVLHHDQCDDGLFCNGVEQCQAYFGCIAGENVVCDDGIECTYDSCDEDAKQCKFEALDLACDDDNACTEDSCDALLGCQYSNTTGNTCNDGFNCTTNDTCNDGVCEGDLVTCNDNNECTSVDLCDETLGCVNLPKENYSDCGTGGICLSGQCLNPCTSDFDCNDGVDCTVDYCDLAIGRCRNSANDNYCDDGLYCNGAERCNVSFGCIAGKPVKCDDGIPCTRDFCDEDSNQCSKEANDLICNDGNSCTINKCDLQNGCYKDETQVIPCDDKNECTQNDYCVGGMCNGHESTLDCSYEENGCMNMTCDARSGCVAVITNDKECTGDACALQSVCKFGECLPIKEKNCEGTNQCVAYSCHPIEGCRETPTNGVACDDQNACTVFDTCNQDSCEGAVRNCEDNNDCTVDDCDPETGCTHLAKADNETCILEGGGNGVCRNGYCSESCTGACSDNNACTENDSCVSGYCQGDVISCEDDNPCTEDSCNPATGCDNNELADHTACTISGKAGECISGSCEIFCETDNDCDDQNPCTTENCDPAVGCSYEFANDVVCTPESQCAVDGLCFKGECLTYTEVNCDDHNPCTVDSCDPESGCAFDNAENGTGCNDLDPCTKNDVCTDGVCSGTSVSCEDSNPCTHDVCSSNGVCENIPLSGESCEDDNLCTSASICDAGVCVAIENTDCDDQDPCTNDKCYPASGCEYTGRTGNSCSDDNICTVGEVCRAGVCEAGEHQLECTDDDPCTINMCESEFGCVVVPMDDWDVCDVDPRVSEVCIQGDCVEYCETNEDCNDGIDCTEDTCDIDSNVCSFDTNHLLCDDGVYCNGAEICDIVSGCIAGNIPDCDDEIECTDDICDVESDSCYNIPQDFLCDDNDECTVDSCDETTGCENENICGR